MFLSIADRISIKFHDITGGNISSDRALRLAKELKGVQNIPDQIAKALSKKIEKHPELQKTFPRDVNINLASSGYNKPTNTYQKEMTKAQTGLNNLQGQVNNFDKNTNMLASKILDKNQSISFRVAVNAILIKLGTSLGERVQLESKMTDLRGKNYALENNITSDHKTLDNLTKEFGHKAPLAPPHVAAQKSISNTEEQISTNKSKISTLKETLAEHQNLVAHAVIGAAEMHKDLVNGSTSTHINEFKAAFSELKSAPDAINNLSRHIESLKETLKDTTTAHDNPEFLKTREFANDVMKDTKLTLNNVIKNMNNIREAGVLANGTDLLAPWNR